MFTVVGRSQAEITEKKSRFICHLAHTESEEAALEFLDEIRKKHIQARHNVYAYIVGNAAEERTERIRYSDDGEPHGTSGMPTLEVLQHAGLTDVCAVTTRYFGGTLLGTGGLVRAYTEAAQAAVDAAQLKELVPTKTLCAAVPYSIYEQVAAAASEAGATTVKEDFGESVTLHYDVPAVSIVELQKRIVALSRNQATIEVLE